MNLSSGYKTDMSYLGLCFALLDTALKTTGSDFKGTAIRKSNYTLNKRIDIRMSVLRDDVYHRMTVFCENYPSAVREVEKRTSKLFRYAKPYIKEGISYDYLAVYILHLRFLKEERTKPLHDDFKWLEEKEGQLFALMDLLEISEVSDSQSDMFNLAYKIVNEV